MSRIGRMPIPVPKNVEVDVKGSSVRVKGPKGELQRTFPVSMDISIDEGIIEVKRSSDNRFDRSLHGMTRALINNMVVGVSTGYQKILEVNGVGSDGKSLRETRRAKLAVLR